MAVIVAEALAGSEEEFAKLMTAKAHALGMTHTTYRNASGLPEDQQLTTARDMAILGRAIQDRFPKYYQYFSTRTFAFHGKEMRNHNHLLGNIAGVDGIKTGYIHDSGFNIVISIRRNNRHIVAVVFGGRTAECARRSRRKPDRQHHHIASTKRTAPPVTEGWAVAERRAKERDGKSRQGRRGNVAASGQRRPSPAPPIRSGPIRSRRSPYSPAPSAPPHCRRCPRPAAN